MIKTALYDLMNEEGGKFVDFAGYALPINFPAGMIKEHIFTRENASIFDVSHMGQLQIFANSSNASYEDLIKKFYKLCPSLLLKMKEGSLKYSVLLNENGGIIDDIIISKPHASDSLLNIVLNASCKHKDKEYIDQVIGDDYKSTLVDKSLLALQGPKAREVLISTYPMFKDKIENLEFMRYENVKFKDEEITISCCGYTGEDGFEISISNENAAEFTKKLLQHEACLFAGLGSRDSLRIEAGLCLYGQDIDENITPLEASISFVLSKKRLQNNEFNGAKKINEYIEKDNYKKRVGLLLNSKMIARAGYKILQNGKEVGYVSSGCFSPILQKPIAFGYVDNQFEVGSKVEIDIRNRMNEAEIVNLPFIEQKYFKNEK